MYVLVAAAVQLSALQRDYVRSQHRGLCLAWRHVQVCASRVSSAASVECCCIFWLPCSAAGAAPTSVPVLGLCVCCTRTVAGPATYQIHTTHKLGHLKYMHIMYMCCLRTALGCRMHKMHHNTSVLLLERHFYNGCALTGFVLLERLLVCGIWCTSVQLNMLT